MSNNYVQQLIDSGTEIYHYGVPGMRWGHRKARGSEASVPVEPQPVLIKHNPSKKSFEATGGGGHKPSDDALTAIAIRQKARASGAASLSNKEMEVLVKRLNLEQNYAKVMAANAPPPSTMAKGKKIAGSILKGEMDAAFKGKKGPFISFVQMAVGLGKQHSAKQKAQKTAARGAAHVATKVLVGRVVN